jgi:hypothetical protein
MRNHRPVGWTTRHGSGLALAAVVLAAGCTGDDGVSFVPCTPLACETGSPSCCLPAYPGVWDPALELCFCPDFPGADVAIDTGSDADADSPAETEAAADADLDVPPDVATDEGSADERGPYPPRPYGLQVGDTMFNYAFVTSTGYLTLQDVRLSREHTVLLLYLGSESCAYCGTETPTLNDLYTEYEPQGLQILGVLADDNLAEPSGAAADEYFRVRHGAEYLVCANPWSGHTLMSDLYPDGNVALPENFVVDLETMRILERMDGYPDSGGLAPFITPYL